MLLAIPLVLLIGASRGRAAQPVARAGSASASATAAGAGRTSRGRAVPRIAFDTTGYRGRASKTIMVKSNDPARPVVKLRATGTVRTEVELSALGLYLGKMAPGSTVERSVSVRPLDATRFSISGARSDDPAVRVTSIQSAGGGYQATVQVGPIGAPRTVNAKVVLATDLPHQKKLIFRVYGRVTAGGAGVGPAR